MDGGADARRITIHKPDDFAGMLAAGRLAAETLDMIVPHVRVGVTTDELDRLCHDFILAHGATPAPLNYRGFPKSICTSINHVVCHGIPGDRRLLDGDVLNIDVTVVLDGWHGDTSRMYVAGTPSTKAARLMDVTYESLQRGVAAVRPGATLGDVGHAIQSYVEANRFSVVRDFCGHGIGRKFHEAPNILHFGKPGRGARAAGRHVLHDRTDGECGPAGGEGAGGWLDSRDPGPNAVGAVRAHGRRDRDRVRGVHALAGGADQAAVSMTVHSTVHRLRFNDTDKLGHVNNAVFAVMLEQGRSELMVAAGLPVGTG